MEGRYGQRPETFGALEVQEKKKNSAAAEYVESKSSRSGIVLNPFFVYLVEYANRADKPKGANGHRKEWTESEMA